ncbi:hypothetical protein CHS0354_034394 [Potamilus streckersoni]|nr:hypothetical protein CHS0354_034394 [Potamilus streckersoni]
MKFSFLTVVLLLIMVNHKVLSYCPESGCECGEHCVNSNGRWCRNNRDSACSCQKGCLVINTLVRENENKKVYCNNSFCSNAKRNIAYTETKAGCAPSLTAGIDYPETKTNPKCAASQGY